MKNSIFNAVCKTRYLALLVVLIFTCGNVWGAEVVAYTLTCPKNASNSAYGSTYDATISGITWNAHGNQYADGDWRFGGKSITKTDRRAYSKTQLNEDITKIIIAFGAKSSSGITINSVKFNVYSTAAKAAALGDGDVSTHTLTYSANGTQTITVPSGKSWNGRWYSVIFNVTVSGSSNKYAALKSITFYKEDAPSCTTNPTVTAASNSSVTATTATVTCSSGISSLGSAGCSISSYGFVIGTSSNPSIGGSGVTKHEVGTSYTSTGVSFSKDLTGLSAETTYYVRPYATNGNSTAYGTQTSFTTSALPKYTVTLKDNDETLTQASAGATVTLPTRTGCTGYTFAGWTKTWVAPQSSWTTTAPTIIPAGSYTPSANENLYPVYTKTEGGGSTPASITLLPSDFGSSYPSGAQGSGTITKGDYSFTYGQYTRNQNGTPSQWCAGQLIQARCTLNIGLWNTTAMDITSVVLYKASPTSGSSTWAVYEGTASAKPTAGAISVSTGSASSITADKYENKSCSSGALTGMTETPLTYTASSGCKYINIAPTNGTSYFTKIVINYTETGGSTTSYISVPACCTDWSTPAVTYSSSLAINASEGVTIGSGTTHGAVTYESSDEDVLTVDADGTIHAVGAGTAHITATWAGDATYCEKSANSNDVTVSGIQVTGTTPVNFGQVYQNAVIADKTIYVTGLGLASDITPSLPAGSPFSFSPASLAKDCSGATLTISASTATLGTYNQTLTLTSGAFSATVTVKMEVIAKPTATFTDALHELTTDKDGASLNSFNLEAAQGTPVVFPTLANQTKSAGTCEGEYYIFVGWTEGDNNTDPEDYLVTSHTLANGDAKHYYAVWADASGSATYTKLTSNSFSTSAHYVIGAESGGTDYFLYSCEKTDANNSWGLVSSDPATDAPIQFTLSGTASALVAASTEATTRYLKAASGKQFFGMSSSSTTVVLGSGGTIESTADTYNNLRYNSAGGLRWYTGTTTGDAAYFYEVGSSGTVHYRTSCCANKVDAPVVTATTVTSTSITLTWPADVKATGWEVSWNGGAFGAPSGTCTHTVSGLTPNTTYTWKVRATYNAPQCGADTRSGSTTTHQVYHVTYAKGSGTGSCTASGSTTDETGYEAGATVTLQTNDFTLSGNTFAAWTTDDPDVVISSNQFTMPDHDVVITATWTAKADKYFDRMHDQTDASHGGVAETEGTNEGKYYILKEGCNYSVPTAVDRNTGDACQTSHYKLQGWIAASHMKGYPDHMTGEIKTGEETYIFSPTGTKTATGATYYAIWAEVTE